MKNETLKKYKKEILISSIYIIISIILYLIIDLNTHGEIFNILNMLGIGVFGASLLINLMEKLSNKMIDSGRLSGVKKVEKTKYTIYIFFFGISSLLLSIVKVILT